jgi:thiamine biosynthesis lipoprotein
MMEYTEFRAMNSDIVLAAQGDQREVATGLARARRFICAQEQRLTRFSGDSELTKLNNSGGAWFEASETLFEIITESLRMYRETGGMFSPAILPALRRAGYDRSFDQLALASETSGPPAAPVVIRDLEEIELDRSTRRIRIPVDMQIDLGGIAKGWIAERAAWLMAANAEACAVSAGGDMFLIGLPEGEAYWRVTLEDPRDAIRSLAVLRVGPETAVATSSVTRRKWLRGGEEYHHLIDPRTAEPAKTNWLSVTVISERMSQAEAMAKSLLIAGDQAYNRVICRDSMPIFIAVDREGQMWGSPGSKELLDVYAEAEVEARELAFVE